MLVVAAKKLLLNYPAYFGVFAPISREPDFSQTCGFRRYLKDIMFFHLTPFIAKSNDKIFFKIQKTLFLTPFFPKTGK